MPFITTFFYSQLFVTPRYPTEDFSGKTVIVTGANAGLGSEAARHFARLNAAKVIIACRTVSKGEKAKESILASIKRTSDCVEVWQLDLSSAKSVNDFAKRAQALDRIDALVENAGINIPDWYEEEGFESTIKVNVISTFQLALLLLPKLRETAKKFSTTPHLEIVSSEVHHIPTFPEQKEADIYAKLNDKAYFLQTGGQARYQLSKLLEVLFVRELIKQTTNPPIITLVNPGLCYSELMGKAVTGFATNIVGIIMALIARTTEVGSRTLVAGACAGSKSHGEFMSDCDNQDVAAWIRTPQGEQVQKKVYDQTIAQLEEIVPGISKNI